MDLSSDIEQLSLAELKAKSPADLLQLAEELEIENASSMRKGDMMFSILKDMAEEGVEISGDGVLEVLQDGFGFLRSPEANYLAGPDDIYVSPNQIRRFNLRTGDTVEGVIRAPKEGERYFGLVKVSTINFEDPEQSRHKIHFDNLTPLYPDERIKLEIEDPTIRDRTARVIESSRMTTSRLCSTRRLAFSITISATATWRVAGSSKVEATTSPFTERCMSVTSSGRSSTSSTIK